MNEIEKLFEEYQELDQEEVTKVSVQIASHMFGYFSSERANESPMTLESFQKLIIKTMKG